jgi:thiol-disulfide isomerase/thioredoxin
MKDVLRVMTGLAAACLAVALISAAPAPQELALSAKGPEFNLKGTDGAMHSLDTLAGKKGTAVVFTCNECPFSKGYEDRLVALAGTYEAKGIAFVAINPNDPKVQPGDGFEFMVKRAKEKSFPFPYLFDATQTTAMAYGARVTPHVFLLDAQKTLVYRGRVDDSLEEKDVKSRDFQAALDALVAGKPAPVAETKAFGCGVKWSKAGA